MCVVVLSYVPVRAETRFTSSESITIFSFKLFPTAFSKKLGNKRQQQFGGEWEKFGEKNQGKKIEGE